MSAHPEPPDPYRLDPYLHERLLDEMYNGRTLARVIARKLARRLRRERQSDRAVAFYAGIAVFDRPELQGGGLSFGQDMPRVLNELGIGRAERLFEYCAGPGYIGFALLAAGWCETLALSDVNPAAVAVARRTVAVNGLEDVVSVYESDALEAIPAGERWDLVVSNPPHFEPDPERGPDIRAFDPGWQAHQRFYGSVKRHMRPGGRVVMMENELGSDPGVFDAMIRAGGGRPLSLHPGTNVRGEPNGLYYQVSEW